MIKIIVCTDMNNGIGNKDGLLVHLPNELKHFKKHTVNNFCLFGRKTYESLPVKPLPKRISLVMSRGGFELSEEESERAIVYDKEDIYSIMSVCKSKPDVYICGGAQIYKEFLHMADEIIMTVINHEFEADSYFPELDYSEWDFVQGSAHHENGYDYAIINYKRKG